MKTSFFALLLAAFCLHRPLAARAETIDFTGVNLAAVASPAGQDFPYVAGSGGATGVVTVRLVSGTPSSLQAGSVPDALGFYALQSGNLTPMIFRFTFDVSRSFTIKQNEYQADIEVNSFTLSSGAWEVLSATDTTPSTNGSTVTFVAANGVPPYGNFALAGTGTAFDFQITNSPGYPVYGSAISVNVLSGAVTGPEVGISLAVRLRWQSQLGKSYQPQYSLDLNSNVWTNLGAPLPGTGQVMELFDTADFGPKKFYRVQTL